MCDPVLVTLLEMRPNYSQSSRENAAPSGGTSPLASYEEIPPPSPRDSRTGKEDVMNLAKRHKDAIMRIVKVS